MARLLAYPSPSCMLRQRVPRHHSPRSRLTSRDVANFDLGLPAIRCPIVGPRRTRAPNAPLRGLRKGTATSPNREPASESPPLNQGTPLELIFNLPADCIADGSLKNNFFATLDYPLSGS